MKLRGRITVAFLAVLIIPLCLITLVVFVVFQTQFNDMEQNFTINEETLLTVANPIRMVNRLTRSVYNEVKLCATKTPKRLENREYMDSLNQTLQSKFSFLLLRKNEEIIYCGNDEMAALVVNKLPDYGDNSTEVDGGTYIGGQTPFLIKQKDFQYVDGAEGSVFVVTSVSQFLGEIKGSLLQVTLSVVVIMFLTAVCVTVWLYRGMLRPLQALQVSTNRMKEGDLDVSVQPMCQDEIGELCGDFEEMRLHMKRLLEEKMQHEQETRELISNISHDLKTPLTAIKGYAEGILDGVADTQEKREKYLKTIYTKANDMSTLVDELSMYAKIDTNSVPYHFQSLNLNQYMEDSIEENKLDLELQNVDLAYFPYADKNQEVIADSEQLKRVVNNILSNSVKYREPTRKGIICIRTTEIDDYYVRIEFEDNGKGIAAKDLPNIFERFYRADASRNSSSGGSGLGLAISRKIIEDHGGKIWAESRVGVGTTVFLLLRKVRMQEVEDNPEQDEAKANERSGINSIVARWYDKSHDKNHDKKRKL